VKEPIMSRALIATTIVSLFCFAACAPDGGVLLGGNDDPSLNGDKAGQGGANGPGGGAADGTPGADPTQPGTCKEGIPHAGFAKVDFVADRKPGPIGADRRRVKPYTALRTEFQRALGTVPPLMAQSVAAFGDVPTRWYIEPSEGAVSLYTTYTLAFTGCYDSMTAANFGQVPTQESATIECAKMQRKFWQRSPAPEEAKACADLAVGLTTETVARRRWAHACASIITSAGFTTY
jgi:hypothetical protein